MVGWPRFAIFRFWFAQYGYLFPSSTHVRFILTCYDKTTPQTGTPYLLGSSVCQSCFLSPRFGRITVFPESLLRCSGFEWPMNPVSRLGYQTFLSVRGRFLFRFHGRVLFRTSKGSGNAETIGEKQKNAPAGRRGRRRRTRQAENQTRTTANHRGRARPMARPITTHTTTRTGTGNEMRRHQNLTRPHPRHQVTRGDRHLAGRRQ